MPNRFFPDTQPAIKILGVIFTVAGLSLIATPANAGFQMTGFQWVAPAEPAPAPMAPVPLTAPGEAAPPSLTPAPAMPVTSAPSMTTTTLAGENPEIISPIIIEGQPLSSSARPSLQPSVSVPGQAEASSFGTLPTMSIPDTTVQGFANNVPLAVALREVLPPGYGFSIDQDVDLGTLVSFQGGRPWRETLQTMLNPAGLTMREQNAMVAIGRASVVASASESAVAPTLAPQATMAPTPITPAAAPYAPPANGPRPQWTQPEAKPLAVMQRPPMVASSRISSASVVDTWTGARGDTLHKVLENWSRRAGTEFEWLAEYDYPLQASISFTGTYEEAVRSLLSGFEEAHPQPVARLHANPGIGQMVLVVETRGNNYTN